MTIARELQPARRIRLVSSPPLASQVWAIRSRSRRSVGPARVSEQGRALEARVRGRTLASPTGRGRAHAGSSFAGRRGHRRGRRPPHYPHGAVLHPNNRGCCPARSEPGLGGCNQHLPRLVGDRLGGSTGHGRSIGSCSYPEHPTRSGPDHSSVSSSSATRGATTAGSASTSSALSTAGVVRDLRWRQKDIAHHLNVSHQRVS